MNLSERLEMLLKGKDLSITESSEIASAIINGDLTEAQTSAILVALRAKGESPEEIAGFAISMKNSSIRVGPWYDAVDTAGTGGDGVGTFNASTASAIIISRIIRVAKHGNRGVSSRSGSADFLEALGYDIIVRPEEAENLLRNSGFVFLFAQLYHPSMKNVAPVRKALGIRTIFNVLGPLTNPAGVKRQVVGVFSTKFMVPVAEAFVKLGAENIYLVHGHPGIDEVSISGQTSVIKVKRKGYERFNISIEDLRLTEPVRPETLKVNGPEESALRFVKALKGKDNAIRKFVSANAAIALLASERVKSISDGLDLADQLVEDGLKTLRNVISSHGRIDKLQKLEEMV
ncbi:MAG: anthranilate phosphoribosyltransferase [Nitrososphaeria archaeon]|jgi:anthranilate phosphoribosyltransferase